jgi:hypothetical protein
VGILRSEREEGRKEGRKEGELSKLCNEFHNLHSSPNIIREIELRWMMYGRVGRPEEKILFGRPTNRWKDNIKMDLYTNRVRTQIN